jgi:hypothetical protein
VKYTNKHLIAWILLKGLSIWVPDNWWVGYSTFNLNDGKIVSFDENYQKWNILLDTQDDDELYLLAYDAVCEYLNKDSSTFSEYQLPFQVVLVGDDAYSIDGIKYKLTPTDEWSEVNIEEGDGHPIEPIEFWGENEEFTVNITDEEIATLKDASGEIRYEKVFQWDLPKFGEN